MRLKDKVAVVTGGAMGIGRSIVELFAREGASVIAADIERAEGERVAALLREEGWDVRFAPVDVTSDEDLDALFRLAEERHGSLDVLVNNAGVDITGGIMGATLADWERCVAVDLRSIWLIVRRAVPLMRKRGGGSIINLSSMHGIRTSAGSFPYSTVKMAVIGLTRSMAVDLGQYGIRVNTICPGLIETRMSADWIERLKAEGKWQALMDAHPLRRSGVPEDIARVALFLASDDSSFVTGIHLFADGGHHAVLWGLT